MAGFAFNIGKGRAAELSGANWVLLLLEAAEANSVLQDYDTVADLLAAAGNTELADASYARKTGLTATVVVDDVADDVDVSLPDQTFPALAGADPVKAIVAYSRGAGDANLLPITGHDVAAVSDGSDITIRMP